MHILKLESNYHVVNNMDSMLEIIAGKATDQWQMREWNMQFTCGSYGHILAEQRITGTAA